jgi:probable phosphoglycerate mutase
VENRNLTRLCVIRHGETDWNVERRIQGHLDIPLNAAGRAQAEAAGRGLRGRRFAAAYSSDLGRAWATAEAAVRGLDVSVRPEPGLRERHYGIFQGLTAAEGAVRHPAAHARYAARDPHYDFETGESLTAFAARVVAAVEALAARHRGESLLLVSHGGVLDILYRHATGRPLSAPRDFSVPNAALNWLEVGAAGWRVTAWADRRHLERALEEAVE